MERIVLEGGVPLKGAIQISGAKNAVLPIIAASLLADGDFTIYDTPWLADVENMCEILASLGVQTEFCDGTLHINTKNLNGVEPTQESVRKMRASFLTMGPLLTRFGKVKMCLPGGCAIGARPIDLHLKGFEALGAQITIGEGHITAEADHLIGSKIYLDFPSVGATENIMMAAVLAEGNTNIENAAAEPEIVDLANFLNAMGAKIKGAGTKIIRIQGVNSLQAITHTVIPDRVEAGSFLVAAAATGGDLLLLNVIEQHLQSIIAKLKEAGIAVEEEYDGLRIRSDGGRLQPLDIKTLPYPGFATDMQPQFMALMTRAKGTSVVAETVFENRFMHVAELQKMGADIRIEGNVARIQGIESLTGADVTATDLRAGAALVIAGLMAKGCTRINEVYHIDRGYEKFCAKLEKVGARIKRIG